MKSYSNDIPNVSTDEIKKSALTADETKEIARASLAMMKKFEDELPQVSGKLNGKMNFVMVCAAIAAASSTAMLVMSLL